MQVISFDFHNTLGVWPSHFDLEVRSLPARVLEAIGAHDPDILGQATSAYRTLRQAVVDTGNEVGAYDATQRVLDAVGFPRPTLEISSLVDSIMASTTYDFVPVPGAIDTVRFLASHGVPLAIISSTVHHRSIEWALAHLELDECFHAVVTSASSGYYKSVPAMYEHAYSLLDATPGRSLHVGDSLRWDVTGAARCGISTVWLTTTHDDRFTDKTDLVEPDFVLSSMVGAGPTLLDHLRTVALTNREDRRR